MLAIANDSQYYAQMVICICNNVKSSQFSEAAAQGCCSVGQLYRQLGCQPQCGKCVSFVKETYLGMQEDASR